MKHPLITVIVTITVALALSACGQQMNACTADSYPSDSYATNAADQLALRDRFEAVAAKVESAGEDMMVKPTAVELETLFAAGTPSVKSITLESARPLISEVFTHVESAAGKPWTPVDPPVGNGGMYGGSLYSERGVDLAETYEKIAFATAHYHSAATLMTDEATPADVDRMLALFGASPAFPMDTTSVVPTPDVFSAKYAKRRTNPEAATPGPYLAIKAAFINARAATAAGSVCAAQRGKAFADIRDQWERTMLGTAINYLNSAASRLDKAAPTESETAAGIHSLSEAVGFLRGLRALPASMRIITDAQLDEVLATVGGATLDGSANYSYATNRSNVSKLSTAISQLQAARSFTSDEIATFKSTF